MRLVDYAFRISGTPVGASSVSAYGDVRLQDLWARSPLVPKVALPEDWPTGRIAVTRQAIAYLYLNPDTAHMLDLPREALESLALMGSEAALLYYPFAR